MRTYDYLLAFLPVPYGLVVASLIAVLALKSDRCIRPRRWRKLDRHFAPSKH